MPLRVPRGLVKGATFQGTTGAASRDGCSANGFGKPMNVTPETGWYTLSELTYPLPKLLLMVFVFSKVGYVTSWEGIRSLMHVF